MTAPRVSVILPTYNRASLLPRSAGSVLAQDFRDLELLIIDDGSTDGTAAVVARMAASDPRVRYLPQKANAGAAAARNAGLAAARGDLVAFQDSDDEWLPGNLRAKVAALDADPGAGVVYSTMERRRGAQRRLVPDPGTPVLEGDLSLALLRRNLIGTPTAVARRSVLDAAGPMDAGLRQLEDWDLWLRVAGLTRFRFLPQPLVASDYQEDSLSLRPGYIDALGTIVAKHRARFERDPRILAWHLDRIAHQCLRRGDAEQGRKAARHAWRTDRLRVGALLRAWMPSAVAKLVWEPTPPRSA